MRNIDERFLNAATKGDSQSVIALLTAEANVHTEIIQALLTMETIPKEIVRALRAAKAANVHTNDIYGWLALNYIDGWTALNNMYGWTALVHTNDIHGRTALHLAADWGHTETVELLLANNADVDTVDRSGRTALDLAVGWGHTETAEALRAAGSMVERAKQLKTARAGDGSNEPQAEAQFRIGQPAPLRRRVHAQYKGQPRKSMFVC